VRPDPPRRCGGTHFPFSVVEEEEAPPKRLALALPNRDPPEAAAADVLLDDVVLGLDFASLASLSLCPSFSIPSLALASFALVSSTRSRSAISSCSFRFFSSAFMSNNSAAPPVLMVLALIVLLWMVLGVVVGGNGA